MLPILIVPTETLLGLAFAKAIRSPTVLMLESLATRIAMSKKPAVDTGAKSLSVL